MLTEARLIGDRRTDDEPAALTVEEMDRLVDAVQAGNAAAREELIRRCTPMVRFRARRERERRRAWGSMILLDDLVQDGMVGLLKGVFSYRAGRTVRDPLAYLATWVVQEMRRRADKADHDWDISTEMAEKMRRVRAIRSRLSDTLGRSPTTAEILAAADDPRYCKVGPFVRRHGRADGHRADRRSERGRWTKLSERDISVESRYRNRLTPSQRLGANTRDGADVDDLVRPLDRSLAMPDDFARIDDQAAGVTLQEIVEACLARLDLPELARTIIERLHGLRGHRRTPQRDLARALGLPRDLVADAARWFADAMAQPGGVFFCVVTALGPFDRDALGLSWVTTDLSGSPLPPPAVPRRLVDADGRRRRHVRGQPAGSPTTSRKAAVRADLVAASCSTG